MSSTTPPTESTPIDESHDQGRSERPATAFDIGNVVGNIARRIEQGSLSTGDLAELRRISPNKPFTPALWRTLISLEMETSPGWISQHMWERRWATLFMSMAFCPDLHSYEVPLGQALARAGWSELRFVRLMRAEKETLEKHIRRVSEYLANKSQPANWTDVGLLLFYQSGDAGERIRLSISRRFYSELYENEKREQ